MYTFLFICHGVFRPTEEFFTHEDVTITDEWLQIMTYARHLHVWPLRSEGSIAWHTYCDT